MKVEIKGSRITLTRGPRDPKFHGTSGAKGEHALFHHLKTYLNSHGNDMIKKRAQADGHMMGDEFQPILRTRSPRSKGLQAIIYSPFYAIRGAEQDWNEGKVTLALARNPWRGVNGLGGCGCSGKLEGIKLNRKLSRRLQRHVRKGLARGKAALRTLFDKGLGGHFPGRKGTGQRFAACVAHFKAKGIKPRAPGDSKEQAARKLCAFIGRRAGRI